MSGYRQQLWISIHSLRMEGDGKEISQKDTQFISIHSLRMEGDRSIALTVVVSKSFQSTPSAWRETDAHRHRRRRQ